MSDIHHPQKVGRSGAVYTSALIFQKILSFTYFSLVAAALGPEKLGLYVFTLSFAAFFSLAVDFGFVNLAIRNFARAPEEAEKKFNLLFTIRLLLAFLGIVLLGASALALGYDRHLLSLLGITAVIMVMDAFSAYFYTIFRARQNLFYEAAGTVIFQIIVIIVGVITLRYSRDLRLLLSVIALGSFWQIIFSATLIKRKLNFSLAPNFNRQLIWTALRAAWPFFLATAFIKAYNTLDTILLKNISGDLAAGLYAIPAKVTFTFPFLAMGVTAAVYPAMSNYYGMGQTERLCRVFARTVQFLLAISLPIAAGISLLAQSIVMRIWPQFSASIQGLQILIWAVIFLFIEYPFGSLLLACGLEKRNTVNRGIQLATFIVLNLVLIPRYGFMGAVWTAFLTSIEIVFLGWLAARRRAAVFTRELTINLLKLTMATGLMAVMVWQLRPRLSFLLLIPLAAVVYFAGLIVLGVYGRCDWNWMKGLLVRKATLKINE